MPGNLSGFLRFDEYEIDRAKWQLRHRGDVVPVNRKTFDLLLYLAEHADRVVSKDELLRTLWPDSFVEESNLTQHVFLLRKALARHSSARKMIETVPGRGYRFAVPVEAVASAPPEPRLQPGTPISASLAEGPSSPEKENVEPELPPVQRLPPSPAAVVPSWAGNERRAKRMFVTTAMRWSLVLLATIALLTIFYLARSKPAVRQSIASYQQITHDGRSKWLGGTDGSRIYYTQADEDEVAQISVSGGAEAPLPLAIKVPRSGQVSPDGSTLLIVSQADGQGPANSLWSVHLIGGSYRRLGNAVTAAWSPDGEKIICASAGGDLYVMRNDGSETRLVASPGGYVMSLAWSPDGSIIRFTKDGLLWQMSPDGRNLRQLLPGWGKSPTQWSGNWSRDGAFFFVADGQIWELASGRSPEDKADHPVQLTFGPMAWDRPVPSLDGKTLFASGRVPRGELERYDPKTAHLEPFLAGISAEFVSFSADRRYLAYVSYPEGRLWRADFDGSHPLQLTDAPVHPKSIAWSPDGSQILFVDRTESNVDAIFLVASDGSGKPQRLLPGDRNPETDPTWSPNGKQIAFATSPNVGASAKSDLRVVDLASAKVTLLPASDGLLSPRWSPDGRVLAAMPLDTERLELYNLATGRPSPMTTGQVAFPLWSHDGRWIYYIGWDPDAALMRIRVPDGRREVITPLGAVRYTGTYTLWMGLDPDDNPLMLRDEGSDDIYALTLR